MNSIRSIRPLDHRTIAMLLVVIFVPSLAKAQTTAPASTRPVGPERWEADIAKFEAADRAQMPAPHGIVFVGSSSIRFWDLKKSFPDLTLIGRGFGGSMMEDAGYYARRIVTKYEPSLVVLYEGDNDIAAGRSPQKVLAGLDDFVATVHGDVPEARIILLSVKPSPSRWKWIDQIRETNRLFQAFADQHQQVRFVDMTPLMLDEQGAPREELFRSDMLHMNDKGYQLWSEKLRPMLVTDRQQ